jgi:tetratricopeptide (TPR) repeat protein
MSDSDHIDKLIQNHRRRLQVLQEQQAIKGLETPPSILLEIEDIKAEIGKLQRERKADLSSDISSVIPEHQATVTDDKLVRARLLRRKARTAYEGTNYTDAEEHLRLAVQLDPDEPSSWGLFGRVLNRLGKYDEAVPALSRAIELTQLNRSLYMLHRGVAYTMLGKYGRALDDFENRIKISPKGYRAFRWRAMVWLYLHRPENSLVDVDHCIALKPEYICAHATKAIALFQLGRMEDATNELAVIDTLHPEGEGDFYCLALAYSKLRTPRETVEALRIAIERDSRYIARSLVEPLFEHLRDDSLFLKVTQRA